MRTHRRLRKASLLTLCVLLPSSVARAQTADSTAVLAGRSRTSTAGREIYAGRIPLGATIYSLDSTDISASAGQNLSMVLQALVPGLSVLRSGGRAAEGSRVQLRGPHSILMSTQPIVMVDGIRVNAMQESSVLSAGLRTSRLDDIAPEDIASIDVLPGPAATSLLGPGASGGALLITTKRGEPGSLRWSAGAESRVSTLTTEFPPNYRRRGIVKATGQPTICDLVSEASGTCTPTQLDVWNPLEEASPFGTGRMSEGHLSLAGNVRQTLVRAGVSGGRTRGITGDDDAGRLGLRAQATRRITDALDLGVHAGYTRTSAGLPWSGQFNSAITAGLLGAAADDARRGYLFQYFDSGLRQRATHWLGGASATWRPRSWLTASAVYGRDELHQHDAQGGRRGELTHTQTTTAISAAASYDIWRTAALDGRTTIGYERLGSAFQATDSMQFQWSRAQIPWTLGGPWIRQEVTWRGRLVIGGGLRQERRKSFEQKLKSATFKTADASWSFGDVGPLEGLRLRGAYGEGGAWMAGDPGVFAQGSLFNDVSTAPLIERTAESEVGLDVRWGSVVTLALTAFRSDASHLWAFGLSSPSAGSGGLMATSTNRMRNEGVEASLSARLLDIGSVRWDATVAAATLRNRVRDLGVPISIPTTGFSITTRGAPVESYLTTPYTYADANGDGLIDTTEVHFADTWVPAGSSLPTQEVGLRSTLSIPGGLTARVLLDYRGGHKLLNANEQRRCADVRNCRAYHDPTASLADQAAAVAARARWRNVLANPYIEDASFVKLRELSLTWSVPGSWARWLGGRTAALTMAGHNLATWTDYRGLDPEIDTRPIDRLPRLELGGTPIPRELVFRLDIGS